MPATLPDDTALDANDFPARLSAAAELPALPAAPRGVRLDVAEEMGRLDADEPDDGPELPDVEPDGYPAWYDDYDRYQAAMSRWIDGRGPRPE